MVNEEDRLEAFISAGCLRRLGCNVETPSGLVRGTRIP